MRQAVKREIRKYKETFEDITDDTDIIKWASSLHYELNVVNDTLERRGMAEKFDYFLRRLVIYKTEYPNLGTSGDFSIVKRIILAEIRLDEMDEMDISELIDLPKTVDAFTRLHTQLVKDVDTIGATSKQKRKDALEVTKILINHNELRNLEGSERETKEWMRGMIALPE